MLYNIILLFILFFSILELFRIKIPSVVVKIILFSLSIVAAFRYGIGADYFNYEELYNNVKTLFQSNFWEYIHHGEPGFIVLLSFFKSLGFNYYSFNIVFSLLIMLLYSKFIIDKSIFPISSAFVFFSLYFMTYPFSSIRQAFVIAIFLYYSLQLLYNKNFFLYFISILFLSLFHYSVIVMLVLPIALKIKLNNYSFLLLFLIGVFFPIKFVVLNIFSDSFSQRIFHYLFAGISWNAIIIRIIFALPIILFLTNDKLKDYPNLHYFKQLYLWGLIFYFFFYNASNMASRISVYLKSIDIILYPVIVYDVSKRINKQLLLAYLFITLIFMFYKNISTQIINSPFLKGVYNVYNYPYYTILNKDSFPKDNG